MPAQRRFLACQLDAYGRPCGWGSAPTEEAARKESERQLEVWLKKRKGEDVFPPFRCEVRSYLEPDGVTK